MRPYPEAIALVNRILQVGKARAETITGVVQLLTAEERSDLFHLVSGQGDPVACTLEGIANATAKFVILAPQDIDP